MNQVPDFLLGKDLDDSSLNKLYENKLTPAELEEAKENLASFLKLLVRIDRRITNEEADANN
jgi:hypothetical protein